MAKKQYPAISIRPDPEFRAILEVVCEEHEGRSFSDYCLRCVKEKTREKYPELFEK